MLKVINYRIAALHDMLVRSAYVVKYDSETLPLRERFYNHVTEASAARLIRLANGGNGDDSVDVVPMLNGWLAVLNA